MSKHAEVRLSPGPRAAIPSVIPPPSLLSCCCVLWNVLTSAASQALLDTAVVMEILLAVSLEPISELFIPLHHSLRMCAVFRNAGDVMAWQWAYLDC